MIHAICRLRFSVSEKKLALRSICLLVLSSVVLSGAFSQQRVSGKVVDAKSLQPLESATVAQSGNPMVNAQTDAYGLFSIVLGNPPKSLQVSFVGYQPLIIALTDSIRDLQLSMIPDDAQLKNVVVISNNAFSKFSTLGKIDLELKPVRNTQELMRLTPGLFIAQHAGGGKAEQIFLRGFDCDHGTDIEVSVDGMPVNMFSHAHGQGYADAHFIIPETINNIDWGAGPYYTQHGNFNTAGYVNFSTFNNISLSRVQVEAGRFNTFRALAIIDLLKKNKEKQSAYLAADYYYTDGPTENQQKFNRINVFGKYHLSLSNTTQLSASGSYFTSNWNASGQVPTRAVHSGQIDRFGSIDPSEGGNTTRANANLLLAHRFSNGALWENQAWYSHYTFNLYSDFTFFLNDSVNGDEINQAESRNLTGYLSHYTMTKIFSHWTLNSIAGAGLRYDATDSSKLAHVVKRQFLSYTKLGKIKEANAFAFLEEQASFGKWFFEAGFRLDYLHFDYRDKLNPSFPARGKSILSPKLNIQYTVNPRLQLYVKTGKGFHSNDTRVVVAKEGTQILPAAYATDFGVIFKPSDRLLLNIAAWYLFLQQEFIYVGDDGNIEPSGKTRRQGIDIIARYQFNSHLFANINLNLTRARGIGEAKGQNYVRLAPVATSTGGLFYKARQGWNGGNQLPLHKRSSCH